jgi:hypothetical protein
MVQNQETQDPDNNMPESKWIDLYRIGSVSCIVFLGFTILAVAAYLIYGYLPGTATVADIFALLQNDLLRGLVSLDLSTVIGPIIMIPFMLAVYAALKRMNESYALIALVLGLMGTVLWLAARPLAEMTFLSSQYAAAADEGAKLRYLAAGEAFNALFGGTAWMLSQLLINISYLISSALMLRSGYFSKATAYAGMILSIAGLCIFLPVIGVTLALTGTAGGVVWFVLLARDFRRLGWSAQK